MAYRGKAYRNDGRMSDNRVAWATTIMGLAEVHQYPPDPDADPELGEQIGPNVLLGITKAGTNRPTRLSLTSLTTAELSALRATIELAFDLAEPVVKERDEVAKRAQAQGDDSISRIYRQLPAHVVRDGKILTYPESVHDGSQDVPAGSGRLDDTDGADRGGAGRAGDGLADEEPTVLAPRTTARRLTSLRAFATWAGYPDLFEEYTAPDGGPVVPHPLPEGMDGVRRMIAATNNERQKALVALCGMVGLRMAEALAVESADFEIQGDEVWLTVHGKGEVTRRVPVNEEAFGFIMRPYLRAIGGGSIVGLKDRFARRIVTDLGVKAALARRVSSHDLRATFATAVYDKTKDQRLVQWLLGHKSGKTTEGYIGVATAAMRAGVAGL